MAADPQFGMGLTSEAVHHCAAFAECHDLVLIAHLQLDHAVSREAIYQEPVTMETVPMMMHMHLHGRVHQIEEEGEEP